MGVERQTAKVNWLTSLGMIVAAGTFYQARKLSKNLSALQIKDFLIKYGFMNAPPSHKIIVPKSIKNQVGEWESILESRKKYAFYFKLFRWLDKNSKKP
jgi:hypothetical protein